MNLSQTPYREVAEYLQLIAIEIRNMKWKAKHDERAESEKWVQKKLF